MAEVIDIIHKLTYETNPSVLEAVNKEFGTQLQQLQLLKQRETEYSQLLDKTAKSDIRNRQAIELLLQRNKQQYDALSISVGKQFSANERLNTSLVKTGRNLGSLSMAGSQLLREAPAFTYSLQTGILALSNNIPILLDQLSQARKSGSTTTEIFKALGGSVFGLTGLLTIGVSILTIFGDKLFRVGDAAKSANDEYTKFLEGLKAPSAQAIRNADEQIEKLNTLRGLIVSNAGNSKNAFDQLKRDYPGLLKDIKTENDLRSNPQIFKVIEDRIKATERANAAQKVAVELTAQERKQREEVERAESTLEKTKLRVAAAQKRIDDLSPRDREGSPLYRELVFSQAQERIEKEKLERLKNVLSTTKSINDEVRKQGVSSAAAGSDTFIAPSKELKEKEKDLGKISDRINEIARGLNHLSEADFEEFGNRLAQNAAGYSQAFGDFFKQIEPGLIAGALESFTGSATPQAFDSAASSKNEQLRINERDKKIKEAQDKLDKEKKERSDEYIDQAASYAFNSAINTLQSIYDMQLYYLDKEIQARQERVDQAVLLAEKGNTEILESERNGLIEAQNEREKIATRQLQINALLQASSAAIAATQAIQVVTNAGATGDPYTTAARIAAAVAALAAGFAFVTNLTQAFKFKDGVIDLNGPGNETSDSIPARLSRGESVMTAKETKAYKPFLEAMRNGSFDKMLVTHAGVSATGKNDYKSLEKRLDKLIEATEAEKFNVNTNFNERGYSQRIERIKKQEADRWR